MKTKRHTTAKIVLMSKIQMKAYSVPVELFITEASHIAIISNPPEISDEGSPDDYKLKALESFVNKITQLANEHNADVECMQSIVDYLRRRYYFIFRYALADDEKFDLVPLNASINEFEQPLPDGTHVVMLSFELLAGQHLDREEVDILVGEPYTFQPDYECETSDEEL